MLSILTRASQLLEKNMMGKYNEIPIDGKHVSFLIPFSQPWMEVTLNISEMEADVSTPSPSP